MLATTETYPKPSLNRIVATQRENFRWMEERNFEPTLVTRKNYNLPFYPLPSSLWGKRIFPEQVIKDVINKEKVVTILDLGCGAGFWLDEQKKKYGRNFLGYGISASDYRRPEQRRLLIPAGELEINKKKETILKSPDGLLFCVGYDHLQNSAEIEDEYYYKGDAHDLLRLFPEGKFDMVVSYQACQYFFDPLRVLKGVYRVLKEGGFAFLESFRPMVFDQSGEILGPQVLTNFFTKNGYDAHCLKYKTKDGFHTGLSLRKGKNPRLNLPISYREIVSSKDDNCFKLAYQLKG